METSGYSAYCTLRLYPTLSAELTFFSLQDTDPRIRLNFPSRSGVCPADHAFYIPISDAHHDI